MQQRKLMLLNEERRAEALADLEAQEEMKRREREIAEKARRKEAAAGIFRCLLDLKQPVAAARAARVRLGMCETEQERRKVIYLSHVRHTHANFYGIGSVRAVCQGPIPHKGGGQRNHMKWACGPRLVATFPHKFSYGSSTCGNKKLSIVSPSPTMVIPA